MLRLPTIRNQFPELAETADREEMSCLGFLAELLLAECDDRARRRSERRIKAAGFPPGQVASQVRLRRQPEHRRGLDSHPRQV
ncbi:ATP-binding protein [Streptomyces sp. ISL-36]|uniref:ATP-binding protein n=1 Tax=Streptomyces sp. ISL-36 TaxID=2819182 RepID=UPI002034CE4A|nr:ATP-binding protein [Streptomyces sp. ISL-36]